MSAKYTSLIWAADLPRPLKLVALALADNADSLGIVLLGNKKMIAWLTGYTIEDLNKGFSKLLDAGVLVQMPETRVRFSAENIPLLTPYWQEAAVGIVDDPETTETLQYQLRSLHIMPETADELVSKYPAALITQWIEIYQEAAELGLAHGSGFLVSALRRSFNVEDTKERILSRRQLLEKQTTANTLPVEFKELLQKMGWEDDLEELSKFYKANPDRTLAWAKHTTKNSGSAGKFRKSLRSGLNPPINETALMPPLAILDDGETSSQDDWPETSPEAQSAWQDCMSILALMGEQDRGFSSGNLVSWLEQAKPISIECTGLDTRFTVRSCTSTAAAWIERNARGVLEDVLGDVLNQSVSIESVS
jgi:hypothetical protein